MLKVAGRSELRKGIKVGQTFDVSWVPIEDPEQVHTPGSSDGLGVFNQGVKQGAAVFARLEGCWHGNDSIYLNSTSGGEQKLGQVWQYHPKEEQLTLVFESTAAEILDSPDNITVSPRGGIVLCEDGDVLPHRMHGMTPEGQLFPFAKNNVVLKGEHNGFEGDFRDQEWAGATFDQSGKWLFVNIQTPGITFAITGPWGEGLL